VLEDTRLDRCDLANVAIEQGRFVRVELDGCKTDRRPPQPVTPAGCPVC
jgi:hypothetical protein